MVRRGGARVGGCPCSGCLPFGEIGLEVVGDERSGLGAKEEALDNPGGFFDSASDLDLGAGGVLGLEKGEQAAEAIAKKTGIGVDVARKVLPMLVPLVLAYLMRKGTQDKGTADRKGGMGAILDRDGDGKILDDIAGMVEGFAYPSVLYTKIAPGGIIGLSLAMMGIVLLSALYPARFAAKMEPVEALHAV